MATGIGVAVAAVLVIAWVQVRPAEKPVELQPADVAPPTPPSRSPAFTIEPAEFQLGDIEPQATMDVEFVLRNIGTEPLEIERVVSDCSCAVPEWPFEPVDPDSSATIRVTVDTGPKQGVDLAKRITALVRGQAPVDARIRGRVREYTRLEPAGLTAAAEGAESFTALRLQSVDGSACAIVSSTPDVVAADATQSGSSGSGQLLRIDWNAWRAAGSPPTVEILTSHPKSPPLVLTVRAK